MKKKIIFLLSLLVSLLVVFAVGKALFMIYNHSIESFTFADMLQVWHNGLSMDMSTAGYVMIIPWLCCLVSIWHDRLPLKKILKPYMIFVAILLVLIIGADMVLYTFWQFKLNAAIFSYMTSPEGATSSTGLWFLVWRSMVAIGFMIAIAYALVKIVPERIVHTLNRFVESLIWLIIGGLTFVMIRGGVQESTMNVGVAYYSHKLFLNHAAVNPAFSLMSSFNKSSRFTDDFNYYTDDVLDKTFTGLYPDNTDDITDTLLTTTRPQVLFVFMESFGGKFVAELGGEKNVSPNFSRLIKEGVFWDNYYSNSFRTDRGTVSTYSGYVSYPTASLMRLNERNQHLPAIAKTLQTAGYSTTYIYGGDIKIMGKKGYLINAGYQNLVYDKDFSMAETNDSKWGANDGVTAQRAYDIIAAQPLDRPWHLALQTLSSHEPFDVPYHRLDDKVLNAFAYTDECVGGLIDKLKKLPVWNNLLVVILPDHGYMYKLSYENPEFFHCPMLWVGGAVKQPRVMHTLMNQSDLAATLLAQMNLPHADFTWSRNVLSKNYTYPFAYCTFPSGILFVDQSGRTVFDITSKKLITEQPAPSPERLRKGKAILQKSYDLLDDLR